MLVEVRYKNNRDRKFVGIPVMQWYMNTELGKKLRFYLLMPAKNDMNMYCEVHVAVEEDSEWLMLGEGVDFTNKAFQEKDLPNLDEKTKSDLYFVWDDGSEEHMDRARQLYKTFQKQIDLLLTK